MKQKRSQGLTQEEVEARSGYSQQYLSSLERGRRNPTIITLYELAQALDVSHVDLVMPTDDAKLRGKSEV
ncbi:XRE family transcriptional regulator protein (plasmid) [Rhizobium gallicum]|uniref:XRE family transcriptional regulator protein n=1 Tax=Rhizobium gallicum TaxID=56730 RepID=A0A1L5NXT2_9HYPH|nr:helix-turn-helix transcriptional regulator [Rhizobium gallicum]APO72724.1 XRE family transcriptional regulator protein [Rhizobium gallicum]